MKKTYLLLLVIAFCSLVIYCNHQKEKSLSIDLPQIKKSGYLTVLTLNRSTSYFEYRGEKMGFQYELAEQFAQSLGLKLRVKTARNINDLIKKLKAGEGDIITYDMPITKSFKDSVLFCGEQNITHQVLVQPDDGKIISNVTQLVGKDIYIKPGRFLDRMINLNKELGGGIRIHEMNSDNLTVENLIMDVSEGKINYTIADNDEALLNKTYYENIDVSLAVSFDQRSSWAVRKNCPLLAQAATKWYKENISSSEYNISMKRYFKISKQLLPNHYKFSKNRISPYDHLFKRYAKKIGWDWRLLAALAYKESNFNPKVVSWAGARGLMQLMPQTARTVGLPRGKENVPEESIKAAVEYIDITQKDLYYIKNSYERLQFTLAIYNAGTHHIQDAMALAKKYGKNPHKWNNNVEKFILLKSNEKYYNDPVCKSGYFRGIETYCFVRDILSEYKVFKIRTKK